MLLAELGGGTLPIAGMGFGDARERSELGVFDFGCRFSLFSVLVSTRADSKFARK